MKITPKAAASAPQVESPMASANASKARAVEAFNRATQAQGQNQMPVANPNQISAEEMSAIRAPQSTAPAEQDTEEQQVETAPEAPAKEEAPKVDPLSSQYAMLARKEKALRAKAQQQDQALRAREEALKAREAELSAKDAEYKSGYIPKTQLKQAALDAILSGELPYDDVVQQVLNQGQQDPRVMAHIQKLEDRLAKQEAELENSRKSALEAQDTQYKAALNQIRKDADSLVRNSGDFELTRNTNSTHEIVSLIEQTFKETGEVMDVEEAAKAVEEELEQRMFKVIDKTEKIKKRYAPVNASTQTSAPTAQKTQSPKQTQPMKTLTNAVSSTRTLSAKERAILAFKGELKS